MEGITLQSILNFLGLVIAAGTPALIAGWWARRSAKAAVPLEEKKINIQSRQANGEVTEKVSNAYERLVGDLQEEINRMKTDRKTDKDMLSQLRNDFEKEKKVRIELVKRVTKLEQGVRLLVKQLRDVDPDIVPVFDIPE